MPIESLDDIQKLQATFVRVIAKKIDAASAERPPDPRAVVARKVELLDQLRQQLEEATGDRANAIRLLDEDIEERRRAIADLEQEIKSDQKLVGKTRKKGKATTAKRRRGR
jgi:hypothetical protein